MLTLLGGCVSKGGSDGATEDSGAPEDAGLPQDAGLPLFTLRCAPGPSGSPAPLSERTSVAFFSTVVTDLLEARSGLKVTSGNALLHLDEPIDPNAPPRATNLPTPGVPPNSAELLRTDGGFVHWSSNQLFMLYGTYVYANPLNEDGDQVSAVPPGPVFSLSRGAVETDWATGSGGRTAMVIGGARAPFLDVSFEVHEFGPDQTPGQSAFGILPVDPDGGRILLGDSIGLEAGGYAIAGVTVDLATLRSTGLQAQSLSASLQPEGSPLQLNGELSSPRLVEYRKPPSTAARTGLAWLASADGGTFLQVIRDVSDAGATPESWAPAANGSVLDFDAVSTHRGLLVATLRGQMATDAGIGARLVIEGDGLVGDVDITGQTEPLRLLQTANRVHLVRLDSGALVAAVVLQTGAREQHVGLWRICLP